LQEKKIYEKILIHRVIWREKMKPALYLSCDKDGRWKAVWKRIKLGFKLKEILKEMLKKNGYTIYDVGLTKEDESVFYLQNSL